MLGQKNKEIPAGRVEEMQKQGLQSQEIISNLQKEGYKHEQISQAMDHATVKSELSGMEAPEPEGIQRSPADQIPMGLMNAPSPSQHNPTQESQYTPEPDYGAQPSQQETQDFSSPTGFAPEPMERANYDAIEEIAESIIKEKWDELVKGVGDIQVWKERIDIDLEGVKQELVRTQEKFENLQKSIMGKIAEYSEGIVSIGTDMRALEKVLEKVLSPLAKSVKDLQEVSEKLSTKRTTTRRKKKK